MIRLSLRHALPLALLALGAAVPVYVHGTGLLERDPCAASAVLESAVLRLEGARPLPEEEGNRGLKVLQRGLGELPWEGGRAEPLRIALVRDFDALGLASRGHAHVTRRFEASEKGVEVWEHEGEELPVHWLVDRSQRDPQFAAYVFLHGDRAVARPLLAVLDDAPARLARGPRPTTLLAVGGRVPRSRLADARRAAKGWLFAAWREYRTVCGLR